MNQTEGVRVGWKRRVTDGQILFNAVVWVPRREEGGVSKSCRNLCRDTTPVFFPGAGRGGTIRVYSEVLSGPVERDPLMIKDL